MKVRIKFSKFGAMKFIGHLDVMRYFQKAIRRAEFDIMYSTGFNPHQIMSFASPLGVGLTSDGEYLDIELNSMDEKEVMLKKFNEVMSEGFLVTDLCVLPETLPNQRKETAMSLVAGADYLISVKDGYEITVDGHALSKEEFEGKWKEFMSKDSISVLKKSKKSEKELDIKPYIYAYGFSKEEFIQSIGDQTDNRKTSDISKTEVIGDSHAEIYENGKKVYLQVSAGSVTNIKPELVMEAFLDEIHAEYQPFAYQMHRMEMYADQSRRGMTQAMIEEAVKNGTLPQKEFVSLMNCQN